MAVTRGGPNRKCLVPCYCRRLICVLLILATSGQPAGSLRFTSVQMPALVQRGANFWLGCQYELSGPATSDTGEQLYSVKWYRNNEEFYRLIVGGQQQQQHLESQANGPTPTPPPPDRQQYFAQAGVNVLMSASNATHVRLLNASLESDGSYACEISTQNLSTIRREKEIKVYVLPHLKLNLIGLRSLYSLGERVELNCLSDFSRPAGALGWFINGAQIKAASSNSQPDRFGRERHFELAASTRHKSAEPKLSRASLALKFKLTSELLRALVAGERADPAGNQSKLLLMKSFVSGGGGDDEPTSISGARLFELLKLECRYKQTEVSDVTFNELRVAAASPSFSAPRQTGSDSDRGVSSSSSSSSSSTEPPDLDEENLRRRRRRRRNPAVPQPELELTKSHGTQVSQAVCPARRVDLLAAVGVTSSAAAAACHLDMLAREDPVILEPELVDQDPDQTGQGEQKLPSSGDQQQSPLELPLGFSLRVNCSTLGALVAPPTNVRVAPQSQANFAAANNQRLARHGGSRGHITRTTASSPRWPIIATGDNDDRDRPAASGVYCSDPAARKRLLVSGRTWTSPGRVQAEADSQQQQQQRRHHVAYVILAGATRKQQAPLDDKLSLLAPAATQADGDRQPRKSLVAGQLHHSDEWQEEGGPPPLLEWFINNQEAPRSSARYAPELPLSTVSHGSSLGKQSDSRSRGGAIGGEDSLTQPPLPSIDYVEYFANFERQRPVDQHLMLQLTLEERHFMTPDSMLKLRCSSTQAQVLASDSLSVSLMVLPEGGATGLVQKTLEQQQPGGSGQITGSHWNQRPPSAEGAAGTSHSQIKPKYLHQYPPGLSSQARWRASAGQRHLARGSASQQPDLASVSESSGSGGSNRQISALVALAPVNCLVISFFALLQAALL